MIYSSKTNVTLSLNMGKLTEKEMGFAGFCDGEIFQPQS